MHQRASLLAVAGALIIVAPTAAAQSDDASRATARELASAGVEAFQRSDFAQATAKLEKAYRVLQVPSVGLWSSRALVKQGKLVQASERYREVLRLDATVGDAAVQKRAQAEASAELDVLLPRLPRLTIQVAGAPTDEVALSVDEIGVAAALIGESRPVDPGKHHVVARRGQQSVDAQVELAEGESKEVELRFEEVATPARVDVGAVPPARPAEGSRPVPASVFVGLAFTGAFAIGAGVTGALALGKAGEYDDANNGREGARAQDLSDQTKTLNLVTDALIGAAVVSAGITTYLFVSRPTASDAGAHLRVEPRVGASGAGLQLAGAF